MEEKKELTTAEKTEGVDIKVAPTVKKKSRKIPIMAFATYHFGKVVQRSAEKIQKINAAFMRDFAGRPKRVRARQEQINRKKRQNRIYNKRAREARRYHSFPQYR